MDRRESANSLPRGVPRKSGADSRAGPVPPEAVRAQLELILASTGFRHSERLSRFLKFVVEQYLSGNSSQVKESVLAIEIFDRQTTYDSRVDSVVRVEARRLREKLDKYYRAEGLSDPVLINLQKGSYVPVISAQVHPASLEPPTPKLAIRRPLFKLIAIAAGTSVLAMAVFTWQTRRASSRPLERLTSDAGLTYQPALSPDGKLLAYSSDRNGSGDLDIWVQQVPRGVPVRLTAGAADEVDPSFSPDGTLIAYRAEGEDDGIYIVPALGGRSRLVVRGGYHPRFSPDGKQLAYWTGERTFRTAKVYTISLAGGSPVQLQPEFLYAAFPVWSPDGRYIAFVGARTLMQGDPDIEDWDWWVVPVHGGAAFRAYARQALEKQGLRPPEAAWAHRRMVPYAWSPHGQIVFSARSGDQTNIWRLPLRKGDWQAAGPAQQITFGAGRQDHPGMAADGTLVFAVLTKKSDIWSLPVAANTTQASGPLTRISSGPSSSNRPVISRDGTRIAFITDRSGAEEIWVKDLKSGRETALTATGFEKSAVVISADGSKLAFGDSAPRKQAIYLARFTGGGVTRICEDCGHPRSWIKDARTLIFQRLASSGESILGSVDLSGHTSTLLRLSGSGAFSPSVSADGKWVAVILRTPPTDHRVMITPIHDGSLAPREQWIPIAAAGSWVDKPRWSPNGSVLYYVSDRDGSVCIWARELDPASKKPLGEPKPVVHFHSGRSSLGAVYGLDLAVAEDKLVFNLGEAGGNIWLSPNF